MQGSKVLSANPAVPLNNSSGRLASQILFLFERFNRHTIAHHQCKFIFGQLLRIQLELFRRVSKGSSVQESVSECFSVLLFGRVVREQLEKTVSKSVVANPVAQRLLNWKFQCNSTSVTRYQQKLPSIATCISYRLDPVECKFESTSCKFFNIPKYFLVYVSCMFLHVLTYSYMFFNTLQNDVDALLFIVSTGFVHLTLDRILQLSRRRFLLRTAFCPEHSELHHVPNCRMFARASCFELHLVQNYILFGTASCSQIWKKRSSCFIGDTLQVSKPYN